MAEASIPIVQETVFNDWVLYGEDNLYPMDLVKAWQLSATHNALTNGISQMIAGEGIEGVGLPEDLANFHIFSEAVNKDGLTLKDLIDRTAFDLYLHGYFGWQIIWNVARTSIAEIYHLPAEGIRSGKMELGVVKEYYFSPDWERYRDPKFKPKVIKAYDPTDRSAGKQLMFIKQYRPSQYYYSTPDYIGAMNWILLDDAVGEFHLNNIENGFFPSALIQFFNGEPPQSEKDSIEGKFKRKFTGKGSNKLAFIYNEGREDAVQLDTFEPANLDKRFRELMPEITQKILTGHRVVSPMLFGLKDNTGLGNNAEEIKTASLLFNKMVVIPYQIVVIRALKEVLKRKGVKVDVSINTLQPLQFTEGAEGEDDATAEVEMSAEDRRIVVSKEIQPFLLKKLKEVGQTKKSLADDGFVLVKDGEDYTAEGLEIIADWFRDKYTQGSSKYASDISSDPEADSDLDYGLYKVRYEYFGPQDEKNRDFCDEVLTLDLIYRVEDINQMSDDEANPAFGSYDIFQYKGSYNCRHKWKRLVFFRKRDNKGRFLPPDGLLNDRIVRGKPPYFPFDEGDAIRVNKKVQK